MKQLTPEYVKIPTGKNKKVWLLAHYNAKGMPIIIDGHMHGTDIKTNKEYTFHPSDVIAFYSGPIPEMTGLGMPYIPTADVCTILDTIVPDSMGYESHIAARIIQEKIGKPLHKFIAEKLHYNNEQLCNSLAAEQVDAVALAIYNIEYKKQGMIVGDQTGIGKCRVAAAMIRYGYYNGLKPIFLSEKPNLFSDIYRDLVDIGSAELVPFIVNAKDSKTNIKDQDGNIVHTALPKTEQDRIFHDKKFPSGYDFACATYSQFSGAGKRPLKPNFIRAISKDNIVIMDESHNASGSSNTGEFLQEVLFETKGVVFLSATFAKRPDNMPVYAQKTCISDANMTKTAMVEAIQNGGVALQEVLSSQLVSEGQMIRRERSFEGVEVNYFVLTEKEQEHKAIFDNITEVLRDIIKFQNEHINGEVDQLDQIAAAEGKEIEERKGTKNAGVDNQPYFSKVFQVINQILFSLKARSVAEMAIERMEEGKKPIIAFSSTMESFLETMTHDDGTPIQPGDTINLDYKSALQKGLDGVMRYTVTDTNGDKEYKFFQVSELSPEGQAAYYEVQRKINEISTGISISPIDVIKDMISKAGFTVDEVTGRKYSIQLIDGTNNGVLMHRKKILANDAFRMFNDNELDCLMINQSGSTGASAHAIVTKKVSASQVKQRVMLVLQAELDINREVQKRGRINRTGQIYKTIYDYVTSAIPAEQRLMMMLRKKLKSLDANTTSNQKQSSTILNIDDFLNKYGNKVVTDYLLENSEINELLDDPLSLTKEETESIHPNAASKVSGRVAILTTEQQEKFYKEIIEQYQDYVEYLKQSGKYDLEIEALNFEAVTKESKTVIQGKGGSSVFSENTNLETVEVNVLKKPFTAEELENMVIKNLNGRDAIEIQEEIIDEATQFYSDRLKLDVEKLIKKYDHLIANITNEKKFQKIPPNDKVLQDIYIKERTEELNDARGKAVEKTETTSRNQLGNIMRILKFFYIGKFLYYPVFEERTAALCLGINIDKKKNNPYTPSAIKVKIAIANSDKYIDLTISGEPGKKLNEVMTYSMGINYDERNIFGDWDYFCKDANVNRKDVFIVTGNILQGFSEYTGKLISFTTKDGSIRKGILMPDNFDPVKNRKNFVSVPIMKAYDYIMQIEQGTMIYDSKQKFSISRYYGNDDKDFFINVPKSKIYQNYFKDKDIIRLSTNPRDGFEMKSGQMTAYFSQKNMRKLLEHLQLIHNTAITIPQSVYDDYFESEQKTVIVKTADQEKAEKVYEKDKEKFEERKKLSELSKKPDKKVDDKQKRVRIAKAKATAKLKLLELVKI